MGFEVFDPAPAGPPQAPLVRVTDGGLLLNQAVWDLLRGCAPPDWLIGRVYLLFDRETREVGLQPAAHAAGPAVFTAVPTRGIPSAYLLRAALFVQRYRIAAGEYAAGLGLSKQMVTCEVGPALRRDQAATVDREPDGIGWPAGRGAVRS